MIILLQIRVLDLYGLTTNDTIIIDSSVIVLRINLNWDCAVVCQTWYFNLMEKYDLQCL